MKPEAVRENDALVNAPVKPLELEVRSSDDFQRLRREWTERPRIPKLVEAADGEVLLDGAQMIRCLLSGDESAGSAQVSYITLEPGPGAIDHHQPREDELWFAVEGDWEWTVGEKTMRVGKGAFAYIPRNTTHRFANVGTTTAAMFTLNTPAGHERGFRKVGQHESAPIPEKLAILAAHDFVFHLG